jgi:Transposase DDE domain
MDTTRQQRGLELAAAVSIRRKDGAWIVPSQTGGKCYSVNLERRLCTCPDHEVRRVKCKHIFAVEHVVARDRSRNRSWACYNAAQSEEKARFMPLLADLCRSVPAPAQANGRPRLPLSDMTFAVVLKVYEGFSSRRFATDLKEAHVKGFVHKPPHFNSVSRYPASPELTGVLKDLIALSSLPLRTVETSFAVDSSGFSTCRFVRWFNKKYGRETDNRRWVKCHMMCGVKTKTITGIDISGWAANDTTYFVPLVQATAEHFRILEVSADKAYLSRENLQTVESVGGTPYVPFKSPARLLV